MDRSGGVGCVDAAPAGVSVSGCAGGQTRIQATDREGGETEERS